MAAGRSWLARAIEQFRKPKPSTEIVKASNEIDVVSAFVANRPTPVEGFDMRKMIDEGYRKNVIVYCCINEIAQSAAAPKMILRDRKTQEPVDEHELLDLIARPAPGLSWYELVEALLIHQQTTGIGYIHKGRSGASQIVQLKTVRPDRMTPVPDAQGNVVYWEYEIEGGTKQRVEPEDVAPFRLPDPLNDFHGLAPLAVCGIFGDIDMAAAIYLRDFFANGAMPMGLLKFKTPAVRREDRLRVQREWEETYGGGMNATLDPNRPGRWHNVGVIGGDVDYQPMGAEPAQLRLDAVWGMTETRICATFGVPPAIIQARIGMQFSTYSNQREARRSFWTETLVPIYHRLSDGLTRNLVTEYDEGLELVFDLDSIPELQEDLNQRADRAVKLFAGGVASLNEARKLSDLEELGEGDKAKDYFFVPSSGTIKPKEDFLSGKVGEAPEPPPAGGAPPFGGKPGEAPPFGKKPPAKEEPPPPKEGQALAEDEYGLPFEVLGLGSLPPESETEILKATETLERGFSEAVREAVEGSDVDKLSAALARGDWRGAEKAVACDLYIRRYGEELRRHLVREAQTALEMHVKHHAIVPREMHDGGWVTIKGRPVHIGADGKPQFGGGGGGAAMTLDFNRHVPAMDVLPEPSADGRSQDAFYAARKKLDNAFRADAKKWLGTLSPDQSRAVKRYLEGLGEYINGYARGNITADRAQYADKSTVEKTTRDLDTAISNGVALKSKVSVWHGGWAPGGIKAGDVLEDKGFLSTSLSKHTASRFARKNAYTGKTEEGKRLWKIDLPKGRRVAITDSEELELILPRGSRLRVKNVGKDVIEAEVVR